MVPENGSINLYSPNYPGQYPDNTHCEVNISAPQPSSRLSVAITNLDIGCRTDYLNLTGIKTTGSICGFKNGILFNLTSNQPWVTLLFVSHYGGRRGGTGYEAEFRVIESVDQQHEISVNPGLYYDIITICYFLKVTMILRLLRHNIYFMLYDL